MTLQWKSGQWRVREGARPAQTLRPSLQRLRQFCSLLLPWGGALLCLWLLMGRIDAETRQAMPLAFASISPLQWLVALGTTGLSFWALARYDIVLHQHLRTGIAPRNAGRAGAAAIALSQTLGLGTLTGGLVRWKLLKGLTPLMAGKLSVAVALSFFFGLAGITALALFLSPLPAIPASRALGAGLLLLTTGFALWTFFRPCLRLFGQTFRWPSLRHLGAILLWTGLDTLAACVTLALLLPDPAALPLTDLFPVFLLALAAGIASGAPGGVGPFELVLVALLPALPAPDLLAALLGFRLVYYALPAILALGLLLWPAPCRSPPPQMTPRLAPLRPGDITADRAQPEHGLCPHNAAQLLHSGPSRAAVLRLPQSLILWLDPLSGPAAPALAALTDLARAQGRVAAAYKIGPRHAARLRATGHAALRICDEALIDPTNFDIDQPRLRQLRRKLRQAEKAGISVMRALRPDLTALAEIDAAWQAANGPARGITMGRFCPRLLASQRVYVALSNGRPVAFMSWHQCDTGLCLDLMRHLPELPQGTMHLLVMAALAEARTKAHPQISLAALPITPGPDLASRITARLTANPGLTRFKQSFAPTRARRYALAPSRAALLFALADLARAIRHPDRASTPPSPAPAHHDHEAFAIAPGPGS